MTKPRDDDEIVGAATLARKLGLVATSVSRLAVEGALIKKSRGKYLAWASARSYIAHREKAAASKASPAVVARAELLKIQAERAALAYAREREKFVSVDEVELAWRVALRRLRSAMLALPARLGAQAGLTRAACELADREIRDALTELADDAPAVEADVDAALAEHKGRKNDHDPLATR